MKEHGLIFCPEMIRALLDGRKTRTSQLLKPQPIIFDNIETPVRHNDPKRKWEVGDLIYAKEKFRLEPRIWRKITGFKIMQIQDTTEEEAEAEGVEPENAEVNCSGGAYLNGFVGLWDELYPGSWDRNDWEIALTFTEHQR